jgi:hypothetical protein
MAVASEAVSEGEITPRERQSGGEIMCAALVEEGVRIVFGYPGGAIMPFYDALHSCDDLYHVLVRHEQGATHAADGYARATGKVGVCVATSGPGATNMVTGLANAFMDSVPIVAITGQVARPAIGKDSFQETDVIGVTIPVTKHNILVRSAEELGPAIHEAFAIARSGRPGPVLIDVPKDVQFEEAVYRRPEPRPTPLQRIGPGEEQLRQAADLIDAAQQPLIIAGHLQRLPGTACPGREDGYSGYHDAPGYQLFSGITSPRARHAGYARLGLYQPCNRRSRSPAGDRYALRRPSDRQDQRVRAQSPHHSHRHRGSRAGEGRPH